MIAEYLILNSDETLYWSKANIEPMQQSTAGLLVLVLLAVDLSLLLKLIADYLI